jgi:cysteinyl-tRNA synthetase
LPELNRTIWQAQQGLESEEFITQARDMLRDFIVLTGNALASSPGNKADCLAPLVKALLELRQTFRANDQWTEADAIRNILQAVNITVEDDKNGSRWRLES